MASALTAEVPEVPTSRRHGAIILARHGEPALSRKVKLSARQYRDFWANYEVLGILPGQTPPRLLAGFVEKAGKLVAYAVTSPQRLPQLPDVPTVAEAGLPGYESIGWFGVVAPAGTPQPVIERLNAEITGALKDEAIQARMRSLGVEPMPTTPAVFSDYIRSETRKWAKVIHDAHIKLN